MLQKIAIHIFSIGSLLILHSCSSTKPTTVATAEIVLPKAQQEFRAAWIATVANINWPSKPGLSTAAQQQEAIALLDLFQYSHIAGAATG